MAIQYDYKVIRISSHEELERTLNHLAGSDWEPILYSISSLASAATHYVILRRRPV
jgi:hypothetical protein